MAAARGPSWRTNRQKAQGMVRSYEALNLYMRQGMSFRQVGDTMGVGTARAHSLVKRALERINEDLQNMAHLHLARQLEMHYMVMQEAWKIVSQPCPVCDGSGAIDSGNIERARVWVGMNADGSPAYEDAADGQRDPLVVQPVVGRACPRCDGEGCLYTAQIRLQAMDRHERACGHVAKLLGLYAPERHDHRMVVSWREELAGMSDEEIEIMLLEQTRTARQAVQGTAYVADVVLPARQLPAANPQEG